MLLATRFSPISTYVTMTWSPGLNWASVATALSSTLKVICTGFWSPMCFTVTVLAAWSTATSSPARRLAAAFAALSDAAAGGVAGGVADRPLWAKAGPATAGIATAATNRHLNVFMSLLLATRYSV